MKNLAYKTIYHLIKLYWHIAKPNTFGSRIILQSNEDEILLVQHRSDGKWYLPGGGVSKGESSQLAAIRELSEETGIALDVEQLDPFDLYHSNLEGKNDHIIIYRATTDQKPSADLNEVVKAEFFSYNNLPDAVSPATKRRLAEFRGETKGNGKW